MLQQRENGVADQVHRRLVAGDEQQDAHGEDLALGEPVALLFGGDEAAEQIGTRTLPPLRDEATEVIRQRTAARAAALAKSRIAERPEGVETPGEIGRPLPELRLVARR